MRLLIAVKSCQKDKQEGVHQAIRETWGRNLPRGVDLLFFVGGEKAPNNLEKDEIYLPVSDSYWEMQPKVFATMQYALEKDYDFCCSSDTDAYFEFLKLMSSGFEQYDYSGGPIGGEGIDRAYSGRRIPDFDNVLISPFYGYLSGHAYILSKKALKIVISSPAKFPISEDLWTGQVLGPFIISGELTVKVLPEDGVIHLRCGYSGSNGPTNHPKCQYDHSLPVPRQNVAMAIRKKYQELTGKV
jgi:Galactosyltransferase